MSSKRSPEAPRRCELARSSIAARTSSSRSGRPAPTLMKRAMFSCRAPASPGGITTFAMPPKPVVTP